MKRSLCDTVSETDLYIGNTVTIFGRDLKLIEYLSDATKLQLTKQSERYELLAFFKINLLQSFDYVFVNILGLMPCSNLRSFQKWGRYWLLLKKKDSDLTK